MVIQKSPLKENQVVRTVKNKGQHGTNHGLFRQLKTVKTVAVGQSVSQSVIKSVSQSVSQSVSLCRQSITQSVRESVSKSVR